MRIRVFLAVIALFSVSSAIGCGGDQKKPKSPESSAGITETSSKEDMPPAPADPNATPATGGGDKDKAATPGPAGGVIKVAAMKVVPAKKGKNDKAQTIELKDDGSVIIDGKAAAKIKGDSVDSSGGTSMVTIGLDGSLVGNGVKPGFKFEGDDLANENGTKLSVGDDGAITATMKDGKSEPIAKVEGGVSAKRAALILAVLWLSAPEPTAAPTKGAKKDSDKKTSTPAAAGKKQKKK